MIVSSLERLAAAEIYDEGGILSWRILRTGSLLCAIPKLGSLADTVFGLRGSMALNIIRVVSAILLFAPGWWNTYALLVAACCGAVLMYRERVGTDGSDQMLNIVAISLIPWYALPEGAVGRLIGVYFLVGQSVLSYLTAGIAKALSAYWRQGDCAWRVLNTATFGHPRASAILRMHPRVSLILTWAMISFECAFVLVLFAPNSLMWAILAAGIVFHGANAVLMGLNVFPWAFGATYPLIIWLRS